MDIEVSISQARSVLRGYSKWKARLAIVHRKIQRESMDGAPSQLKASPVQTKSQSFQDSAETAVRRVMRLISERDRLLFLIQCVEDALEDIGFEPQAESILRSYYIDQHSSLVLCEEMGYSQRQFFRHLAAAVSLFAKYLDREVLQEI
ncbi:MAG: hypothetical protein ACOX88_06335 [Christensenellales bacterium]|jgi:hypothetical protein